MALSGPDPCCSTGFPYPVVCSPMHFSSLPHCRDLTGRGRGWPSHGPQQPVEVFDFFPRCLKTFEVEFSQDGRTYQRINVRDTVFTLWIYSPGKPAVTFSLICSLSIHRKCTKLYCSLSLRNTEPSVLPEMRPGLSPTDQTRKATGCCPY